MTIPAEPQTQEPEATLRHLVLAPSVRDEATGALYVHNDYLNVIKPFEFEAHVAPVDADERFGDVESFTHYVNAFADAGNMPFITWNSKGLKATLDYHQNATNPEASGRTKWHASYPFVLAPEFLLWSKAADGHAIPLQQFVEFLDDRAPDIHEPDAASLLALMRTLRANVTATADTQLRADGTAAVNFAKDTRVTASGGTAELPPEITVAIPVLRGQIDEDGQVVRYKLVLKLRASVDGNAKLALRLAMPIQERVLEQVYAERVDAAKKLLGEAYTVLRAAE